LKQRLDIDATSKANSQEHSGKNKILEVNLHITIHDP